MRFKRIILTVLAFCLAIIPTTVLLSACDNSNAAVIGTWKAYQITTSGGTLFVWGDNAILEGDEFMFTENSLNLVINEDGSFEMKGTRPNPETGADQTATILLGTWTYNDNALTLTYLTHEQEAEISGMLIGEKLRTNGFNCTILFQK